MTVTRVQALGPTSIVCKNTEITTKERHLAIGMTEKSKSLTANKETSKILISIKMAIKDSPNLVKEVENLTKVKNQMQDQTKISIMDLKAIQATSVRMMAKAILIEINNPIRIMQNTKESHLIQNHNVLLLVLQSLLKKRKANN